MFCIPDVCRGLSDHWGAVLAVGWRQAEAAGREGQSAGPAAEPGRGLAGSSGWLLDALQGTERDM